MEVFCFSATITKASSISERSVGWYSMRQSSCRQGIFGPYWSDCEREFHSMDKACKACKAPRAPIYCSKPCQIVTSRPPRPPLDRTECTSHTRQQQYGASIEMKSECLPCWEGEYTIIGLGS
ncbi:hypothetical protein ACRALDRAFT_2035394 [Sodiomyces alcalophilus JCM 7366]|uniref:uncharacterized protein n=1 Tax=Sodiomyces alcalophilus JCM 7366 TaxID=591952 RepID=UPI0039B55FE3